MDSDKRVLIGMSGGIDSSAACMILQEQGYEVIGLTMRMWDLPRHFPNEGQTIPQFAIEAKELAEKLNNASVTVSIKAGEGGYREIIFYTKIFSLFLLFDRNN